MHLAPRLPAPGGIGLVLCSPGPLPTSADTGSTSGTTPAGALGSTSGLTDWLQTTARGAEDAGAGAVWTVDHLYWGQPIIECMTSLAVVAAATRRTTVGSCVLQLPLHTPAAVAKQALSLQHLSGGRMVLGIGAGSHAPEFERVGVDYTTRGRRMDAGITELRQAWASAEDPEATYKMLPAAAPVPIWVGGSSPAARRRAATVGDGWIPLFLKPDELVTQYALLADEAAAAGRDPSAVAPSVVVPVAVGDGPDVSDVGCAWLSDLYGIPAKAFARHLVSGPAEQCAERITAYFEAGARHVALFVASARPLDQFAPLAAALGETTCGGTEPDSPERAQLAGVGA